MLGYKQLGTAMQADNMRKTANMLPTHANHVRRGHQAF